MKTTKILIIAAAVGSLVASLQPAVAQGTAFTYQGRLNDGTNPANGKYDLQFQVFDLPTGGTSYGNPNTNSFAGLGVTNGLFTVTLDLAMGFLPARRVGCKRQCGAIVSSPLLY